jgi:hypothetical protein
VPKTLARVTKEIEMFKTIIEQAGIKNSRLYVSICCTCSGLLLCRFSDAGSDDLTTRSDTGVRKAPRHEIASRGSTWAVPQGIAGAGALWGFRAAAGADDVRARQVVR